MKLPIIMLLCVISFSLQADMFTPSHSCSKPFKPYSFSSEFERDRFIQDVEDYRDCLNDFIEEQLEEAESHQEAAQDAADEWERYKRFELDMY